MQKVFDTHGDGVCAVRSVDVEIIWFRRFITLERHRMKDPNSESIWKWNYAIIVVAAIAMTVLIWSYWQVFAELTEEWSKNPLYSHGYLIPAFALFLMWHRRDQIPSSPIEPSWWALAFLLIGSLMRLGAAHYYFSWPDRGSLLFMLAGAALALGGWAALRWAGLSILFLIFMIPFPGIFENSLVRPLQRVATHASTNVMQTLGFFAQADGNVIILSEIEMGIVEACSGLRMLSTFVALTVGASFFMHRPKWQKFVIVLSSVPIALLCNVIRISGTGMLYEIANRESGDLFHEYAGYLMMGLALFILLLEVRFLDLIYCVEPADPREHSSAQVPLLDSGKSPA